MAKKTKDIEVNPGVKVSGGQWFVDTASATYTVNADTCTVTDCGAVFFSIGSRTPVIVFAAPPNAYTRVRRNMGVGAE